MRCDLHVHTDGSGMCTVPVLDRFCKESYNRPEAVYAACRSRGMDLVTVTDHDSLDAVEALRGRDGFFLSEEVTCRMPSGNWIHMGVYGIEERHHQAIQSRSNDLMRLIAYLNEQNLFFSINHAFSSLTGARHASDFQLFAEWFPGMETLNGQMPRACNAAGAALAAGAGRIATGGSDAHTLSGVGRTWTEVPGARDAQEFLAGLRHGHGRVHGTHGNYGKLTMAVWEIGMELMRENRASRILAPLMLAVPAITLLNCARELLFAAYWSKELGLGAALPLKAPALAHTRF